MEHIPNSARSPVTKRADWSISLPRVCDSACALGIIVGYNPCTLLSFQTEAGRGSSEGACYTSGLLGLN